MVACFPDDPGFPQLSAAADPRFMLETFRHHLKAVAGKVYQIEDCAPFRFRCRQSGSRHVLQYTLRVTEPSTGRSWNQWITCLLYADSETTQRLEEMKAQVDETAIPESSQTFDPVGFIPSMRMIVEVYPYDRKLRSLGRVAGGHLQDLDPLLLGRLGPGEWRVENRTVEPTRYRTEFAAAFRYVIRASDTISDRNESVRCYLKVYRNNHGAETYQVLQSLSDIVRGEQSQYSVVKPISYLSELRTLAIEEASGISLTRVLLTKPDPSDELKQVARALAAFNQDKLHLRRRHLLEDQLAELGRASALVKWACTQLGDAVEGIYDDVVQGMDEDGLAPSHGDLKPDHLFLSGERVTFIDLDWAALSDPLLDAAQLLAYIKGRVGLDSISPARTEAAGTTFIEEYFRLVPKSWKRRFPLHYAAALLEVAAGIFRHQEMSWPEKITEVISAAQHEIANGTK
jgi:hypothetical protein